MRIGTSGRRRLPAFYEGPLIIMAREGIQPNLLSLVIARPDLCDSLEAPIVQHLRPHPGDQVVQELDEAAVQHGADPAGMQGLAQDSHHPPV